MANLNNQTDSGAHNAAPQPQAQQQEPTAREIADTIRLSQYFGLKISYERAREMTRAWKQKGGDPNDTIPDETTGRSDD